jgi:tetratricopeptide (TPR) repeat protein
MKEKLQSFSFSFYFYHLIFFLLLPLLGLFFLRITHPTPIDACWNFFNAGDYKKAIEAGKLATEKYSKNSDAYRCLGYTYYNAGELKLAYENMKKAESLTNNKEILMYIYNKIGQILDSMGYLDDALLYYSRSLSLAKDLGNTVMQAATLNNIALIYSNKGELDKALSYYEESLSLTTNEKNKAPIYNNIALIYGEKGDYQKAIEYFQQAIEIDEKYRDYHSVSMHKLNLGDAYRKIKDYKNAEKYLSEGLEGVKKVGDKYWEAVGYKYFGWLYRDKGDKKTARDYLARAYNLYKSIGAEGKAQSVLDEMKELDKSK